MAKDRSPEIKWLLDVEEHDYPNADSYLRLLFQDDIAATMVARLRTAPMVEFKAKDIFRASQLSLLGISNARVVRDQQKIEKGERLSPLLLVRDERTSKLIIADGYHRLCAIYGLDEDAPIRCKII